MQSYMLLVALTLLAGMGIPVMAALNGHLGAAVGTTFAAVVLFVVALGVGASALLFQAPKLSLQQFQVPFQYYLGGVLVAFYILSITWVAPKLGLVQAIFIILLGQIASSVLIEHFGVLNVKQIPISFSRVAGVAFMLLGIYLARRV